MFEIDFASFTPWSALAGGLLIGAASALLLLFNGRIAGIGGILARLHCAPVDRAGWRVAFLLGLVAPALLLALSGRAGDLAPVFEMSGAGDWLRLVAAGLLVGYGSRLANGCTSGHGVCGLGRLSPRSLVAVAVFMGTAFVVVAIGGRP